MYIHIYTLYTHIHILTDDMILHVENPKNATKTVEWQWLHNKGST